MSDNRNSFMDQDIEKVNILLEEGYAIYSHEMKIEKVNDQRYSEKHVVTLKKGVDTQVIQSLDSQEFSNFINHFVKCIDPFDNPGFVYIQDLNQLKTFRNDIPQNIPLYKDHHQLKISGRQFSTGILSSIATIREKGALKTVGSFRVDLNINKEFQNVDFKDVIEVYDNKNNLINKGYVKKYQYTENFGIIEFQDYTLKLEHERLTAELINMSPTDSLAILTQSSGMVFNPPPGMLYNIQERDFLIIVPIQNLIIEESFKIGNVEFYQIFDSLDDSLIRKSSNGRTNSLWNGNYPRAKVNIKSTNFFDAITKGYAIISRAIDIVALRTDISFPSITIQNNRYNFYFSYYKFLSKVKIPTIVYCREINTKAVTFFDLETIRENILSLQMDSQQYFSEVNVLCSNLITKTELTKEEENFLLALHWLRKAIQEGDNKDKFLDLWITFEFLTSGEKTEDIFSDVDKKKIKDLIRSTSLTEKQKKAIESKIGMINDSPLMEKFNQLIKNLSVNFSTDELNELKILRNKRTNLVHGKGDIVVNDDELDKMRTILEKVFIGKINIFKCKMETKQML